MRQSSLSTSNSQTSALQQRINEKRAELDNLKQLRELSAGLAGQMEQLQEKLSTLSDGTQGAFRLASIPLPFLTLAAIATVLSNWHTVLRAIHMASGIYYPSPVPLFSPADPHVAHIAKPQQDTGSESEASLPLPQTLVRIPMQHVDQSELPQSDNAEDSSVK
jgi:DASH complex subunit DAD2